MDEVAEEVNILCATSEEVPPGVLARAVLSVVDDAAAS